MSLVSVVIPTHNRAELVVRAIQSVLRQSYEDFELIIVDDGSTDDTEKKVAAIKDERIFYFKNEVNKGAPASRLLGVRSAKGKFISFLDSDDEWYPSKLEKQVAAFADLPGSTGVVHCDCDIYFEKTGENSRMMVPKLSGNIYKEILGKPGPAYPCLMVRRECFEHIPEAIDPNVPSWQEWDTSINLAKKYGFHFIDEPLVLYHRHEGDTISYDSLRDAEGYNYIVEKHREEILKNCSTVALGRHYSVLARKYLGLKDIVRAKEFFRRARQNGIHDRFTRVASFSPGLAEKLLSLHVSARDVVGRIFNFNNYIGKMRGRIMTLIEPVIEEKIDRQLEVRFQLRDYKNAPAEEKASWWMNKFDAEEFAKRFNQAGIHVEKREVDIEEFEKWMSEFSSLVEYYGQSNDFHIEKLLEHYLSMKCLDVKPTDVLLDVAAQQSPMSAILRQKGMKAYRQDLVYPDGINGYDIGGDAGTMLVPDGFADVMTLHYAYECFQGDADVRFARNTGRILRSGGRFGIIPLYIDTIHFVMTSPWCDKRNIQVEPEAKWLWRDDQWRAPFSRHYSPESFVERIVSKLPEMDKKILYFTNLKELSEYYNGQKIYCHFMFKGEKP